MERSRTALAEAKAERRNSIVRQFIDEIKGEPLDAANPRADWWIVAAFAVFPLFALWEVVS